MKTAPTSVDTLQALPLPPESAALKLFVVLSRAVEAVGRHVEKDAERNGLTTTEWAILEVLYHKGPMLLGEVQRRILVSSGGITYLVDRLEKRGLLERRPCSSDRRARYAALTADGKRLVHDAFPAHVTQIEEAMQGLSADDQRECARLLRVLGKQAARLAGGSTSG